MSAITIDPNVIAWFNVIDGDTGLGVEARVNDDGSGITVRRVNTDGTIEWACTYDDGPAAVQAAAEQAGYTARIEGTIS